MRFFIVDAFAEAKYQGNQVAVFIPDGPLSTDEMQKIAQEMHFSETTFITSGKQENGGYDVRIFTPAVEIPFAGHPTIGTSHVIHTVLEDGQSDHVYLNLKVGQIPVDVKDGVYTMLQNQAEFGMFADKARVAEVLSISEDDIDENYPVQWVSTGLEAFCIPVKSTEVLSRCMVNHPAFTQYHKDFWKCNMLAFTKVESGLQARCFMDDPGYQEDPATGSANGDLAGYLLKYKYFGEQDTIDYVVRQGFEMGRPSILNIHASLIDGLYTIKVGGKAVICGEGTWR